MKIYLKTPQSGSQAVYAHSVSAIRTAEAQRLGRWNTAISDYEPAAIDEARVFDCSPALVQVLEENSFYEGVVSRALNSLYIDAAGICHARSLEA